jgi:5-formyltetrahydrofolate cyclo-ligase
MPRRSSGTVRVFSVDRDRVREALAALVRERFAPDANVVAVHLFGSFSRGDAAPGSDVDLLVVLDRDERPPHERIPDYLPGAFPVGVDVIPWTRTELEARLARGDRLARTILAEGQVLLDRRPSGAAKTALRREVLARRDAMPPDLRRRLSGRIVAAVTALPAFEAAGTVLAYHAFGSEPETAQFLATVLARGKRLLLPRVDPATRTLALHRVRDLARDLRPGAWGIAEPDPARCEAVDAEAVDFVLVPGVAFDLRGGRLGHGGGYYDRLLGACSATALRVAAAFETQVVPAVPMGPEDRYVDLVVTEDRICRAPACPLR